ncbi:MAG: hypothetical protein AB1593_10030 [Pseudomonadota bacterium]
MKPGILTALALSLAASLPASAAQAKSPAAAQAETAPCAKEKFRGKGAKARRLACLENWQRARLAEESKVREEIETLRRELREQCAQDPRSCATRQAELGERLQGNWRDQAGEGHASD